MQPPNQNSAESIAISGLQRLAGNDELLMRFCALTGILPNDIRESATQPEFLAGVLDFYLAHEPDLLAWAEADLLAPETIRLARHTLMPADCSGFE